MRGEGIYAELPTWNADNLIILTINTLDVFQLFYTNLPILGSPFFCVYLSSIFSFSCNFSVFFFIWNTNIHKFRVQLKIPEKFKQILSVIPWLLQYFVKIPWLFLCVCSKVRHCSLTGTCSPFSSRNENYANEHRNSEG